jgi:tRNA (guanine37-N1)-methyltransferase
MRFDVIALFPEILLPSLEHGVTRRAFAGGAIEVRCWPLREHAEGPYRRVDDRPFGGGPGMVMLAEPLARALAAVRAERARADVGQPAHVSGATAAFDASGSAISGRAAVPVIAFSAAGRRLDQALVAELAAGPGAILVCGRYEGIDQRFVDEHVDLELSLGDFVLSGGELAAAVLLDAVARLQPGVLNDDESHRNDSYSAGLLEGPQFTRPERWQAASGTRDAPAVLLGGDHARIARWHREQSLRLTAARRPDLIDAARRAGLLDAVDEAFLRTL